MSVKVKNLVSVVVIICLVLLFVCDTSDISANDNAVEIISLENLESLQKQVDILLDERAVLLSNNETNEDLLKANEEELAKLGMIVCNNPDLSNKLDGIATCSIISGNEELTIGNYSTAYRGKIYDLRVVKMIPNNENSVLDSEVKASDGYAKSTIEKAQIYFSATVDTALGLLNDGKASIAISVITAFLEAAGEANIENVQVQSGGKFVYSATLSAEDTFIFVKKNGETNNNYVYCYNGNKVRIEYVITQKVFVKNSDGTGGYSTMYVYHDVQTAKAVNYDYSFSKACEIYYNAENNNYFQNIAMADHLSYITHTVCGETFKVPMPIQGPFPGEYQYN